MQILMHCDCHRTRHQPWPWNSKPALCNIVTHRLECHQQTWLSSLKEAEELPCVLSKSPGTVRCRSMSICECSLPLCLPGTYNHRQTHAGLKQGMNTSQRDTCWTRTGHEHFTQRHMLDSNRAWMLHRGTRAGLKQGMNTSQTDMCRTQTGHEHFTDRHVPDSNRAWTLHTERHTLDPNRAWTLHTETCWTQAGHKHF